ncbi:MAG: magnesium transporter [Candidatus Omnitrophica bacterium]|nr:magnesium transporter [Candidatus Omnitrophota bacterium]
MEGHPHVESPNVTALFVPEIKALLAEKNFSELKSLLYDIPPMDLAEGWFEFSDQEKILIFRLINFHQAVELFEYMDFEAQSFLLNNLKNAEVSNILNEMAPDDRVKLFKDLPPKVIRKFFKLMKKEEVEDVQELMTYEEGTAGALMTTDFVEVSPEMTAREALLKLQESLSRDPDLDLSFVYVTNESHRLLGVIELENLIRSSPGTLLRELMEKADFIKINDYTGKEEVASVFKHYDLVTAPVVDEGNELLGIITVDDVVELMDRETTKAIYELGKMTGGEGELISYATATVKELVQRRAGWLIFLLVFDFLTGTVLKNFQDTLSAVVSLVFFIPMLLDTGGNAGAQASITVIRGLATGDVNLGGNVRRVVKLELIAALLMGLIVGAVAFVRALMLQSELLVSAVVGISMFTIVLLAIMTGLSLPLLSKKFGWDPAVLAGPITTSVVDVFGLIIYFKVAQWLLPVLR